jgi:hypothetical protein
LNPSFIDSEVIKQMSAKVAQNSVGKKPLTADFIIASIEEYGDAALVMDVNAARKSKGGEVTYISLSIKTPTTFSGNFPQPTYPIYLTYQGLKTFKCQSPDVRATRKGAAPSFSFKVSSVDNKGQRIGKACVMLVDTWTKVITAYKKTLNNEDKIISPIQKFVVSGMARKEIDDPLIRIKFRTVSKENRKIKGEVGYVDNGRVRTTTPDGNQITDLNVHTVATSGISMGIIDFATIIVSQQGWALDSSSAKFIINQINGDTFEDGDFDLADLGVSEKPAEDDADLALLNGDTPAAPQSAQQAEHQELLNGFDDES